MAENLKNWRQGNILREQDALALGLVEAGTGHKVIVISHDCDIPSESDEYIEVVIANFCQENKQHRGARHPRVLHLLYQAGAGGQDHFLLLKHCNKHSISKREFVFDSPDDEYLLSEDEKRSLKQWLASRYGRPAFPDEFEKRLKCFNGKTSRKFKFESAIAGILQECPQSILAVFFALGDGRFVDLPEDEPYELSIYIVYDSEEGGPDARQLADKAAEALLGLFRMHYGEGENATIICLDECIAISDTRFSFANIRKMDQWRLDYISLADAEGGVHINPSLS